MDHGERQVSTKEWEHAKYCREVVNRLKEWFEPWRDKNEDDYQGSSVDLRVDIQEILGEDNVKLTKMVCYHQHTRQVKDGIFCEDCQTQVQTYVLGKKRFGGRDD